MPRLIDPDSESIRFNSYPPRPSQSETLSKAIAMTSSTIETLEECRTVLSLEKDSISTAIALIDERRSLLVHKVDCAQRCVGLASLPDELLGEIFKLAPNTTPRRKWESESLNWRASIRLSIVCSRFRKIMLELPCRWSTVSVDMFRYNNRNPMEVAETFLTRARSVNVTVRIFPIYYYRSSSRSLEQIYIDKLIKYASRETSHIIYHDRPAFLCETLRELASSCEAGSLDDSDLQAPLPNLRTLRICFDREDWEYHRVSVSTDFDTTKIMHLLQTRAPHLQLLGLKGDVCSPDLLPATVKQLHVSRKLIVTSSLQKVLCTIPKFAKLEHLTLDLECTDNSFELNLRRLQLSQNTWSIQSIDLCINYPYDYIWLAHIQFQQLVKMNVTYLGKNLDESEFSTFLENFFAARSKQFPVLRFLAFNCRKALEFSWHSNESDRAMYARTQMTGAFLHQFQSLETLELSFVGEISHFHLPMSLSTLVLSNCVLGEKSADSLYSYYAAKGAGTLDITLVGDTSGIDNVIRIVKERLSNDEDLGGRS